MAKSSTTFKPGQSGNPGGRSKFEKRMRELIAARRVKVRVRNEEGDLVDSDVEVDGIDALGLWLFDIADPANGAKEKDRVAASKELYDRMYGKPKQSLDINDATDGPAPIDWSKVPIERRRAMLALLGELGALDAPGHGDTEH